MKKRNKGIIIIIVLLILLLLFMFENKKEIIIEEKDNLIVNKNNKHKEEGEKENDKQGMQPEINNNDFYKENIYVTNNNLNSENNLQENNGSLDSEIINKISLNKMELVNSNKNYLNKNETINIVLDIVGSNVKDIIINNKSYPLTRISHNKYEVKLEGIKKTGIVEFVVSDIVLENKKKIEIKKNNRFIIEILKDKPSITNFKYSEIKNENIEIEFDLLDPDNSFKSGKLVINDGINNIHLIEIGTVGKNKIQFSPSLSELYSIDILGNYDLDNDSSNDNNIYSDILLKNEKITYNYKLIEFKDINKVELYEFINDEVKLVDNVNINNFNPTKYLAKVYFNNDKILYSEIKSSEIKNNDFYLELKYDNAVSYINGIKEKKAIVKYENIADNISNSNELQNDIFISEYDRVKELSNFNVDNQIAYHNMNLLMPYYDANLLIKYGNTIDKENLLYKEKIKSILPKIDNNIVFNITDKNYTSINKLKIVLESDEVINYDISFEKDNNNILIYKINNLEIGYIYDNLLINTNSKLFNDTLTTVSSIDYNTDIASITPEVESRLYTDYYNENIKTNMEDVLSKIISNSDFNIYLDNPIYNKLILDQINKNITKYLYGYNYFYKWYNFNLGETKLSDILLFRTNEFIDKNYNTNDLFSNLINSTESLRSTNKTISFYDTHLKSKNGKEIKEFIEYYISLFSEYENGNDWLTNNFEGILVEKGIDNKNIYYRAWDLINKENHLLLPILSAPQNDMYIVTVPSQIIIGSLNRYSEWINGEKKLIIDKINQNAEKLKNRFNITSSFIENSEQLLNEKIDVQYDTRFYFPLTGTQDKGSTQDPVIKWVYESVGAFAGANGSGAYANGNVVYWVVSAFLTTSEYIYYTMTHEMAHNQDGYYYYEKNGRRQGTGAEDHADGNLAERIQDGTLVWNSVDNFDPSRDMTNNFNKERIKGKENIHSYYKELYEAFYVLDYLTAQAFLELTPLQQSQLATQAKDTAGYTEYVKLSEDNFKAMNLRTMEDLWDNKIVFKNPGSIGSNQYGNDTHYEIYWYQPHVDDGRSDSNTFKRLGFEFLGLKGYSDGYVTYRSKKAQNDLDALRKILNDNTATYKSYKMNRYNDVQSKVSSISLFDTDKVIKIYKEALINDANNGNKNQTNDVRRNLLGMIKRATRDFTISTIYDNKPIEIATPEQFINEINKNQMGNYKLTNDLDFTNISTDNQYIINNFYGSLNGNNFSIKGLKKPLFNNVSYAIISNLKISSEDNNLYFINNIKHLTVDNIRLDVVPSSFKLFKFKSGTFFEFKNSKSIDIENNVIVNLNKRYKYKKYGVIKK